VEQWGGVRGCEGSHMAAVGGEGPSPPGRQWAASNVPAAAHVGGRRAVSAKTGEADGWGPGNSAGRRQFKFDLNSNSNRFKQI
jgi:hypothetical protein